MFVPDYSPDDNLLDYMRDILTTVLNISINEEQQVLSENDFAILLEFMRETMTFDLVKKIVSTVSNREMLHAQRRWRIILKGLQKAVPHLAGDDGANMTAAKFGRLCVPALLCFVRDGKLPQLDRSLGEINNFVSERDLKATVTTVLLRQPLGEAAKQELAALRALLRRLSHIWDYKGFPFSTHN